MTRILEIKWVCFAAMLVLLVSTIVQGTPSRTSFEKVRAAVTSASDMENMTEGDGLMLRRLYGLDPGVYEDTALYYPASNMSAEELLLVRLSDAAQKDAVIDAIEDRLTAQKENFDGYGAEQMGLLANALYLEKGNYVLLTVSENPSAVRDAFLEAL